MSEIRVALAPFLCSCPSVITLGIRACIGDYPIEHQRLLREVSRIYFPTIRFLSVFQAVGKPTFPSPASYRYPRSRVLQTLLFQHLKLPHPRSRIYFGARQKKRIVDDFEFPCLATGSRPTADPVHIMTNANKLEEVLHRYNPLLVQEFVPFRERIRLIFVCFQFVGALRLPGAHSDPRIFEPISLQDPFLARPLEISRRLLAQTQLDDTMIEWGFGPDGWRLLAIARPPVKWKTLAGTFDRYSYICDWIQSGST